MKNTQSCNKIMPYVEFTRKEIDDAAKNNRLLTLEIEFSIRCNLRCQYCYVPDQISPEKELTKKEIRSVILQAKQLGVRKIIILGGEPMFYPHILEMIQFIKSCKMKIEMFTNGFQITANVAKQLADYGVNVVLKMSSFNENIEDMLCGQKGASKMIWNAFHNLKAAGYPAKKHSLSVSAIICRHNIDELVNMWQWSREQGIDPYFEILTPQGHAMQNEWLNVSPARLHELFSEIAKIDRLHYKKTWDPQPPLVGGRCLRHQFSCLVNSYGNVTACVGVPIPVGNIREKNLSDIIKDSEVIQDLRNYRSTIKDPCRSCEKIENCYGCRGAAYQLTGDYLAADPMCWKNADCQSEIVSLPTPVNSIIPQQATMRVIDTIDKVAERIVEVSVTISKDMPFVNKDGIVDEVVYIEFIAQAIAALDGFKKAGTSNVKREGFLLGVKNLEIFGHAKIGDKLRITAFKYAKYEAFGIIKGHVYHDNKLLAQGEIKIWHDTSDRK